MRLTIFFMEKGKKGGTNGANFVKTRTSFFADCDRQDFVNRFLNGL